MDIVLALKWALLGIDLAKAAAEGIEAAIRARDLIQQLVSEGREPSEAEWETLNAYADKLHSEIQRA